MEFGVTSFEYQGKIYRWSLWDEVYYWEEADDDYFDEVPSGANVISHGLLS